MPRNINTVGGGAQTNANGLHFEQTSELRDLFEDSNDFTLFGDDVFKDGVNVATLYQKHSLYKNLLKPRGIDYTKLISKQLLPDDAILVHKSKTLFIIEKKYQNGGGSVDEKLQTCDFKKKQYTKLLSPLRIKIEYCYYLSEWFKQDAYEDVRQYILDVGCHYFFDEIPLDFLGL